LTAIVQRFPVVLYTGNACNPCNSARTFLQKRGIPFTEKTIRTNADIDALQRIAGDNSLPLITVGQQQLKGFSENDLNGYLEAASYPKSINLPSGYRNGAASPLVAVNLREGTVTDPGAAPAAPPPPPASNAAGIRF
jgi:glutaredoxin